MHFKFNWNYKMFKKLFALGLGGSLINYSIKCCGIIGVLTTEDNAEKIIYEGVQLL